MYKLIKTKDESNEFDKTNVLICLPNNDVTLDDLCEAFTSFIKACDFYIPNQVVAIVPETDDGYLTSEDAPLPSDEEYIPSIDDPKNFG